MGLGFGLRGFLGFCFSWVCVLGLSVDVGLNRPSGFLGLIEDF